jgi:hypothetical protein
MNHHTTTIRTIAPGYGFRIAAAMLGIFIAGGWLFSQGNKATQTCLLTRPAATVDLRVEAMRLAVMASSGAKLANCRPYIAWRYAGESGWRQDYLRENVRRDSEARYLQIGTIGLGGGLFLTSDFPSQWSPEAKEILRKFWNDRGGPRVPSDQYAAYAADGFLIAYRASYSAGRAPEHQVGLYNWADKPQTVRVAFQAVGLNAAARWRLSVSPNHRPPVRLEGAYLEVRNQPPHSLRIAGLTAE